MSKPKMPMAAAGALALLFLSGCATSGDRPDGQLAHASESIEAAEQTGAREFAPAALEMAKDKLDRARTATERGDHEIALRLAREAELDAELAAAQANRGKAQDALDEINESIRTLRNEIARNQMQEDS